MMDLNLFAVFDAVMTERHVGRAATKIGRTQPAVSNALKRLRQQIGDPLFVRAPDGVRPTPRAEEIWRVIGPALDSFQGLGNATDFDPASISGRLTIACTDFESTLLLTDIMKLIAAHAPNIDLVCVPGGNGISQTALQSGAADFAIGYLPNTTSSIKSRALFNDTTCVAMRADNPLATIELTQTLYAAATHLLVSPSGDSHGFMDDALAARGHTRRVAVVVNQFHLVPDLLRSSDMLVTISRRVIGKLVCDDTLVLKASPFETPPIPISLYWHRRTQTNPRLTWLRNILLTLCDR